MYWGHDSAWWLAVAALVLLVPGGMLANVLTPILLNWFPTRTRASLEKSIAKLEKELSEQEKFPLIDEAEDHILWGITSLKLAILTAAGWVIIVVYVGVSVVANTTTVAFKGFEGVVYALLVASLVQMTLIRRTKDFRYWHSPRNREALRKTIDKYKYMWANWPTR